MGFVGVGVEGCLKTVGDWSKDAMVGLVEVKNELGKERDCDAQKVGTLICKSEGGVKLLL